MLIALFRSVLFVVLFGAPTLLWAANQLEHHPSPYLAMHAKDPVDWQLWDEAVFKTAREQNKLIFISIGYFSCHWCHVMQRESYADKEVASLLNQHFVSVKIDRELRPELDRRLIEFVSRVRGSAGWPLNVFLTPEGYPITGFTYLPRDLFSKVLLQIPQQWVTRRNEINQAARQFYQTMLEEEEDGNLLDSSAIGPNNLVEGFIEQSMQTADELQGGFGEVSKFPQIPQLRALLSLARQGYGHRQDLTDFIRLTLRAMASRNLMDHINGGFFRYTTDPDWQTPHFEKMLYDNAQMVLLYLDAEQLWPGEGYAKIAELTLEYLQVHMKHPQGGYVSSLSAVDINDEEGGGYLWDRDELSRLLGKQDSDYLMALWQPTGSEKFLLPPLIGKFAQGDLKRNRAIREKIKGAEKPVMPIDDKRLASWNALMLQALVAAAKHNPEYVGPSREQYEFLTRVFFENRQLKRFAGNGKFSETTFEDYAYVAQAIGQYGEMTKDNKALALSSQLLESSYENYYVNNRWISNRQSLMPSGSGRWVIPDAVISSPLTQWLSATLTLSNVKPEMRREAEEKLLRVTQNMLDTPYYYGSLISLRHRLKK